MGRTPQPKFVSSVSRGLLAAFLFLGASASVRAQDVHYLVELSGSVADAYEKSLDRQLGSTGATARGLLPPPATAKAMYARAAFDSNAEVAKIQARQEQLMSLLTMAYPAVIVTKVDSYAYSRNAILLKGRHAQAEVLRTFPDVLSVTEIKPTGITPVKPTPKPKEFTYVPPYSHDLLGVRQFWGGLNNKSLGERFTNTGEGVGVAVIDSGIDFTHPNFGGGGKIYGSKGDPTKIGKDPKNPISCFPTDKVVWGYDFVGDGNGGMDPNPYDATGHGTMVASIIAGGGMTTDFKAYTGPYTRTTPQDGNMMIFPGLAPGAKLYAFRVSKGGSFDVAEELKAIETIVALRNWQLKGSPVEPLPWTIRLLYGRAEVPLTPVVSIINTSAGAPGAVQRIYDGAIKQGLHVVLAGGNDGEGAYSASSSGPLPITVAATYNGAGFTALDQVAPYSSKGPDYDQHIGQDLAAPGERVQVAQPLHMAVNGIGDGSGTSAAAPHVSGALALLTSKRALSPVAAKAYLMNHAKPIHRTAGVTPLRIGAGRLDLNGMMDPMTGFADDAIWPGVAEIPRYLFESLLTVTNFEQPESAELSFGLANVPANAALRLTKRVKVRFDPAHGTEFPDSTFRIAYQPLVTTGGVKVSVSPEEFYLTDEKREQIVTVGLTIEGAKLKTGPADPKRATLPEESGYFEVTPTQGTDEFLRPARIPMAVFPRANSDFRFRTKGNGIEIYNAVPPGLGSVAPPPVYKIFGLQYRNKNWIWPNYITHVGVKGDWLISGEKGSLAFAVAFDTDVPLPSSDGRFVEIQIDNNGDAKTDRRIVLSRTSADVVEAVTRLVNPANPDSVMDGQIVHQSLWNNLEWYRGATDGAFGFNSNVHVARSTFSALGIAKARMKLWYRVVAHSRESLVQGRKDGFDRTGWIAHDVNHEDNYIISTAVAEPYWYNNTGMTWGTKPTKFSQFQGILLVAPQNAPGKRVQAYWADGTIGAQGE